MFRKLTLLALAACLALPGAAPAQQPQYTTVCAILRDPAAFAGKVVRLHAEFHSGFEYSGIADPDGTCKGGMWLTYAPEQGAPADTWDTRANELQKRQPVFLQHDEAFKHLEELQSAQLYARVEHPNEIMMGGNPRYKDIRALVTGRIDYAGKGEPGFGHLNGSRLQFVLASVADPTAIERAYDAKEWSNTPVRFPHGTVQGRVTDAAGNGSRFATVEAVPVEGPIKIVHFSTMAKDDGTYSLDLKPGRYLLVVNRNSPATKRIPMNTTFYPSATRREDAKIVDIADGPTLTGYDIHPLVPLHEKHLRVLVVWPDGKPVEEANVNLAEAENPYALAGDEEGGVRHTGADGFATLTGFAGKTYRVYADIYRKPGYVPYCEDSFLLPANFPEGLKLRMVLRRQDEGCRGQWDEPAKPLPDSARLP